MYTVFVFSDIEFRTSVKLLNLLNFSQSGILIDKSQHYCPNTHSKKTDYLKNVMLL